MGGTGNFSLAVCVACLSEATPAICASVVAGRFKKQHVGVDPVRILEAESGSPWFVQRRDTELYTKQAYDPWGLSDLLQFYSILLKCRILQI
ncbi:hypothetical protein E2C01_030460 [Portunus trituberculatus]|uniref:Carbohydrate kinase PfkB domain-containing protein n=1 Tax=Portunus trituberculatus TaxID=210409 RepID=A0A5B7EUU7_PORTR|nr:hypothetical protein [Portunus trituberculatus]